MPSKMTQPFLVELGEFATFLDVAVAVSLAAAFSYESGMAGERRAEWDAWAKNAMTKSVRRSKTHAKHEQALELPHDTMCVGSAVAHAFEIQDITTAPSALRSSRVAGLEAPVENRFIEATEERYVVQIADDLGMSAGKAAAQSAHAVIMLMRARGLSADDVMEHVSFELSASEWFDDADTVVEVRDNGLTEVKPGTRTVVVTETEEN